MMVKQRSTVTITLISFLIVLVLGFLFWMFLYKGIQQDKSYSGAKYVRQNAVENRLL
ncbi:MAG: hypothetical protein GX094_12050 [Clostridiales bacterium]|jgi:predicted permease|nr:hypothetical protein [Clostridiales bacterium]